MKSLCIKSNNSNCLNYLLNEFKNMNTENVCFSCNEFKNYKNIIIHYKGTNNDAFLSEVSTILSNLVIDEFDESIMKKYIFHNHCYFDSIERQKILDICFELCLNDNAYYDKKYNILFKSFFNYISNHKSIILNGFINFRLQNYCNLIETIVDEAVNNFIVEREYLEFISLLKLYISSQECNANVVHLIYFNNYSILLDENKNIINISDDIFKAKYLSDISFSFNDYTLNSLLTLIPKKIYIHLIDNYKDEFINTLQLIFENRISLCTDCSLCKLYKTFDKTSLK